MTVLIFILYCDKHQICIEIQYNGNKRIDCVHDFNDDNFQEKE